MQSTSSPWLSVEKSSLRRKKSFQLTMFHSTPWRSLTSILERPKNLLSKSSTPAKSRRRHHGWLHGTQCKIISNMPLEIRVLYWICSLWGARCGVFFILVGCDSAGPSATAFDELRVLDTGFDQTPWAAPTICGSVAKTPQKFHRVNLASHRVQNRSATPSNSLDLGHRYHHVPILGALSRLKPSWKGVGNRINMYTIYVYYICIYIYICRYSIVSINIYIHISNLTGNILWNSAKQRVNGTSITMSVPVAAALRDKKLQGIIVYYVDTFIGYYTDTCIVNIP